MIMALFRQIKALFGLTMFVILAGLWYNLPKHSQLARHVLAWTWSALLRGFGITLRQQGAVCSDAGTLFVCNHISWADIPVLAALLEANFVAKGEVQTWPVIGPLARHHGCIFIDRTRRTTVTSQIQTIRGALDSGRSVILFPEGTTGDGMGVLPFKSSLMPDAGDQGTIRVQPITLLYRHADGSRRDQPAMRQVAWLDDDGLLSHALALAGSGGAVAEVIFEQPILATDRKQAAQLSRETILNRLMH
jgi:1-acyl-sn-glycerol-3-phosphate acyltransferase